jgi:tRNA(Ile)-lysidine synthase TilS/MesJ|tara:strand:- start:22202 stop:22519 length:318 start_codon:yes stop_codon:yes gene_type:complete
MNKKIKYLKELLSYLEYHNRMAPFPMYDTEYVATIREQLEQMEKEGVNYDELPTAACRHCDSLGLKVDELDNDICIRCGSINEINIFPDYYSYELYIIKKLHESY